MLVFPVPPFNANPFMKKFGKCFGEAVCQCLRHDALVAARACRRKGGVQRQVERLVRGQGRRGVRYDGSARPEGSQEFREPRSPLVQGKAEEGAASVDEHFAHVNPITPFPCSTV